MKSHSLNIIKLFFIFLLFLFSSLHAQELANDRFQNWSASGYSRDDGQSDKLEIKRDKSSSKTYDFGSSYANTALRVTFDVSWTGGWEDSGGSQDYFRTWFNNNRVVNDSFNSGSGSTSYSLDTTADSDGKLKIEFSPNTTGNGENIQIDNVVITGTPSNTNPSCATLRDSDTLSTDNTSYSNSSHYNSSDWNVGPNATSNSRAYKFSVDSAGQVDIDLSRIDKNQASFSVSKGACPTTFDDLKTSQLDFSSAGDFYIYIYYIDGTNTNIEHQLDVVFTPSALPIGCDNSLDTSANNSSPGVTISSMNHITTSKTACVSGESKNNDRDYYNFTVDIDGTLELTTSSPNDHDYHFQVQSSVNGNIHPYDTGKNRFLSFDLVAGEKIIFYSKETGSNTDEWQVNLNFTEGTSVINNADDICYMESSRSGTRTIIPITSTSDLTDAYIMIDTSSLFNFLGLGGINDCSVDEGAQGVNCEKGGTGIGIPGLISILNNKQWSFTLGSVATGSDRSISTYDNNGLLDWFLDLFSTTGAIQSTYIKDGKRYRGNVKECDITLNAVDDSYDVNTTSLYADTTEGILENDKGIKITLVSHTDPSHGTLLLNSDGSFTYTPTSGYVGTDSFDYNITDSSSNVDSATVTLNVNNYDETTGGRDFALRHQESIFGNVEVIGNTVICYKGSDGTGACVDTPNKYTNGDLYLYKTSESYSTLTLPTDATVKYARLYWQGRKTTKYGDWDSSSKENAKKIKISTNGTDFTSITADTLDINNDSYRTYSATADLTDYVQSNNSGKYYIDSQNFYTIEGKPDGLGAYGAWVLVVIYEDPNDSKARNITVFDGYKIIDGSHSVEVPVTGFLTPKSGPVDSKTYVFVGEGDKYITGDDLLMKGTVANTSYTSIAPNSNNAFDSRIDVPAVRAPSKINNNGIDIQKYDTGTTSSTPIISNNETGAKFKFTTGGDVYYPSLIVFSTELYLPKLCYDYSIKQDGVFLPVDRSAYPIAQLDSYVSSSDLDIEVYIKNQEADIAAQGIALKSDINDSVFKQVGHIYTSNTNGSTFIDRGTPTLTTPLCAYDKDGNNAASNRGCTTGHDIRKGNGTLDAQDYIYTKYTLEPQKISGIQDLNQTLGLSIKYYIVANGEKIEYPDYVLGGANVPLCPPTGSYQPQWGQFNIVESGQTGSIKNNITTQISRKPFNMSVVFDSTPTTGDITAPTSDINTTILVEMIDLDAFGDINASCANPDANVTAPIFVPINFSASDYQAPLPVEPNEYYNFATKNTAYRIWLFSTDEDVLIQNWTAATDSTTHTLLNSIAGLFDSSIHTECSASCATPSSTQCFECLKINYAKPVCSRDNFAVRPESFDIEIFDINQTSTSDTTTFNLTNLYKFSPKYQTPIKSMDLTTGYNYRFDVNATGHDSTSRTPGYTRYFNGQTDYNATMIWNSSKSGCNDTSSRNLKFYLNSGQLINEQRNQDEIGEYLLNIIDSSWTAVDWQYTSHHIAGNAFNTTDDCLTASTTSITTPTEPRVGCLISTNHGNDGSNARYYKDINITFHPYKFDISTITPTIGLDHDALTINNSFLYMANITQDENMSLHFDGDIIAQSYSGGELSNFVDGCYAKPLDINISRSNITLFDEDNTTVNLAINFRDLNSSNSVVVAQNIDINDSNSSEYFTITTQANHFYKNLNGKIQTRLNVNYDRKANKTVNPKQVTFTKYSIACSNNADCLFKANFKDNNLSAEKNIDKTITYYYGRTYVPRQQFTTPVGASSANPAKAFIYYEVYCNGVGCDKSLLPDGIGSKSSDDMRWFINTKHTSTFGTANTTKQKGASVVSTQTEPSGNAPDFTEIYYAGSKGYPYKTTMENNASNWLKYDRFNANPTVNEFQVEFINGAANWSGAHETNTTSVDGGTSITNRRLMW